MAKLNNVKVLDMVGGEITKIAYDGAEYTKVDDIASKNDIAEIVKAWGNQEKGEFYRVIQDEHILYGNDDDTFVYIDGAVCNASETLDAVNLFRKTLATTPSIEERVSALESRVDAIESGKATEDEPLKIGDYAKVIGGYVHRYEINDIVEVGRIRQDDGAMYCDRVNDGKHQIVHKGDLVRATDEEVAKAKAELKRKQITVGTYVKLAIKDGKRPSYGYGEVSNGDIGVVRSVYSAGDLEIDFSSQEGWLGTHDDVEIVTAEESEKYQAEFAEKHAKEAERKKWAKIGREVGEFKKGDIVSGIKWSGDDKVYGLIEDIGEEEVHGLRSLDGEVYRAVYIEGMKLIVPVEQRFDLPEVTA